MGFSSLSAIAPDAVASETLDAYEAWLKTRTLCRDPAARARQTASNWKWAREAVPGWPPAELVRPNMRRHYTFPLERYPAAFRDDVAAFAARLAGGEEDEIYADDVTDPNGRRGLPHPLRPRTVAGRLDHIRRAAAALVLQGMPMEELRGLRDLVEPIGRARGIRKFYRDRHGKERNSQVAGILETLRQIARHHCRLPQADVDLIGKWASQARPAWSLGMTEKNRQRLTPLVQPGARLLLLHLPEELRRRARDPALTPKAAARLVAYAAALDILLIFPMRGNNLAGLRLDRHLRRLDARSPYISHIFLPAHEMKNRAGMEWPVPPETARSVELYLRDYRPLLAEPDNPYLFVGSPGTGRSAHELAIGLSDLIGRELGLEINLHLLRHFAAWSYLDKHPGGYEIVRQILGHKSLKVTMACYVGLEVEAAARHFDAVVLGDRAATRELAQSVFRKRAPKRDRLL